MLNVTYFRKHLFITTKFSCNAISKAFARKVIVTWPHYLIFTRSSLISSCRLLYCVTCPGVEHKRVCLWQPDSFISTCYSCIGPRCFRRNSLPNTTCEYQTFSHKESGIRLEQECMQTEYIFEIHHYTEVIP